METIARSVLMVVPETFGFDEQTAVTNAFQNRPRVNQAVIKSRALKEFDAVRSALHRHGIGVVVYRYGTGTPLPNAVFPNNWLTTWPDGRVYLYPMATPSRRAERSNIVVEELRKRFEVTAVVDISKAEQGGKYLESTGVVIFDHAHRIAYACIGPRCDEGLFREHARAIGYEPVAFRARDRDGRPIYHTNIMMGIASDTAVLCSAAIDDEQERRQVLASLERTGHKVVGISFEQVDAYCGNVIQLENHSGEHIFLMSESAYRAFSAEQLQVLSRSSKILHVPVPTIQAVGGGSVRCMVAEIYLPSKVAASSIKTP